MGAGRGGACEHLLTNMQKMDHFIPPPDHLHLLSFPLILPRLDTCQHRFSSKGQLMGSERGRSPGLSSGSGSRSIMDVAAWPSACLDRQMGRSPGQALLPEVGSWHCPAAAAHATNQHLHSWGLGPRARGSLTPALSTSDGRACSVSSSQGFPSHKPGLTCQETFAGTQPLLTHPRHHGLSPAGKDPPAPCDVFKPIALPRLSKEPHFIPLCSCSRNQRWKHSEVSPGLSTVGCDVGAAAESSSLRGALCCWQETFHLTF